MPKEIIASEIRHGSDVFVGWSRGGDVQVETFDIRGGGSHETVLGRDELGQLIRVLKRARDQAYGS